LAYYRLGENAKALADLNESKRLDPTDEDVWYLIGLVKIKNGDNASGEADIAKAKEIKADVAEKWNGFGVK